MPVFPRAAKAMPLLATPPRFPEAFKSWGQSGKGQMRSTGILGREWEETYPILDTSLPAVRALLTSINKGLREGTVWQVKHPYWNTRLGDATGSPGTPLVNGSAQTGASLNIDGFWANSCSAPINIDQAPWTSVFTPIVTPAAAIAPDGTLTAVRIQDDNATNEESRNFALTVTNNSQTHLAGVYVRKRAVSGAYPALYMQLTGGTIGTSGVVVVNPLTGTYNFSTNFAGVIDVDENWWFVWAGLTNNSTGNTTMNVQLRPAFNNTGSTTAVVSTQGSTEFWGVRIQLNVNTPTLPVKPWLRTGDLVQINGLPVVLDQTADLVLLGASAVLSVHPPVFVGQSPLDNTAVVVDPANIYFNAVLVEVGDFPPMDSTRYIDAGLTLKWREQPL